MCFLGGCPVAERLVGSQEGDADRKIGAKKGVWCSGLLDFTRAVSEENPIAYPNQSPDTGFMNI